MKLLACSVYDGATRAYMQPFFCRSKAEAIRSFADACQDEKSNFARHAADFHLAVIGEFDDAAGVVASLASPERLISAVECIQDNTFPPDKRLPM